MQDQEAAGLILRPIVLPAPTTIPLVPILPLVARRRTHRLAARLAQYLRVAALCAPLLPPTLLPWGALAQIRLVRACREV